MKRILAFVLVLALALPVLAQSVDEYKFSLVPRRPTTLPANSAGYLLNDGSGGLSYAAALKPDGTVPLTADYDVGAFTITAKSFTSDVAIGTAPFAVTSTTAVTNLNADMVDGFNSAALAKTTTLVIASATSKTQNADYYCDGTADEVQINAAIQALDGLGGRIVLLEGTYNINAPILFNDTGTDDNYITLEGQGDATILKTQTGNASTMAIIQASISATWLYGLQFRNFKIDGNNGNVTGTDYGGLSIQYTHGTVIDNVTISNGIAGTGSSYGIYLNEADDVAIINCHINSWGTNGLEMRESDRVLVAGNFFNTSRFEVYSTCNQLNFSNNIVYETCIGFGTDATVDTNGINVVGNLFYNPVRNISSQLRIDNADNISVSGNFFNCIKQPLSFGPDVSEITITGNTIYSAGDSLCSFDGTNGLITGNKFIVGVENGIGIFTGTGAGVVAANWVIRNNTFSIVAGTLYTFGVNIGKGTNIYIQENTFGDNYIAVNISSSATSVYALDNNYIGTYASKEFRNQKNANTNWSGRTNRRLYKFTATYADFAAAALTGDKTIATVPAKAKIVGFYADTTTKYTGGTVDSATLIVGKSAGGGEYIAVHDVFTAAVTKGLADADMGTELVAAALIQGGAVVDWTTATTVYARLTTTTANTNALTAGSTTFYIETEEY